MSNRIGFLLFVLLAGASASAAEGLAPPGPVPRSIADGVAGVPALTLLTTSPATVVPPPPGSTVVDFDALAAPCEFVQTTPLRDALSPLGVTFSGPSLLDGGAVLHQCGNFDVQGHSAPNFLAFNLSSGAGMLNGGRPRGPEVVTFQAPVTFAQINAGAGHASGGTITLEALDVFDGTIDVASAVSTSNLTTLWVSGPNIVKLRISFTGTLLVVDDLAFQGPMLDQDADGLGDAQEAILGTDPANPDSDQDGLLDGFEVRFQLDPLVPGEGGLDPDQDLLITLEEQFVGTHPMDSDTDNDGLDDGPELLSHGTHPLDPDVDDDDLSDGSEIVTHATDPNDSDTDDGGAGDGLEVRDGTDPLDSSDDVPSLGMVLDDFYSRAVILDAGAPAIKATVPVPPGPALQDCVVSADGKLGFSTAANREVSVVALLPPAGPAPGIHRIPITNVGVDLALSPDGRYLVVCGGNVFGPISVVDVAGRVEHGTFPLASGCNSVDICLDGSVLVTTGDARTVRLLRLSPSGQLSDTGESLGLPTRPSNVYCAPDGGSGLVLEQLDVVTSFTIPGLEPVSQRELPGSDPISGGISPAGDRFYARMASGLLHAFGYHMATATLGSKPQYSRAIPSAGSSSGVERMALDTVGAKLFVPRLGGLLVVEAEHGGVIDDLADRRLRSPTGVCFPGAVVPDSGGSPPVAVITGGGSEIECSSPSGGTVTLDGSASTDPDVDIAGHEWFEHFGQPNQVLLGSSPSLSVTLSIGFHSLTLRVTDEEGSSDTETVVVQVVDTTPPMISLAVAPRLLWPPNHRMVDVTAAVSASDLCGSASLLLQSVTSSEPDDAPGGGDGHTVGDIQGATPGAADFQFAVRAERAGGGEGRTYTISYGAVDLVGNVAQSTSTLFVPLQRSGGTDPVALLLWKWGGEAVVQWTPVENALHYNAIRGRRSDLSMDGGVVQLGPTTCLGHGIADTLVRDAQVPLPGETFVYLVEYDDGQPNSYGSESTGRETRVTRQEGSCP